MDILHRAEARGLATAALSGFDVARVMREFEIDERLLSDGLRKTSYAISSDETRYVLNGIFTSFKEGKLTLVATDGRRLAIKSLLMTGSVVVGVGNIYANEALFLAGIHPQRPCNRIALAPVEIMPWIKFHGGFASIGGGADEVMLSIICKYMGTLPGKSNKP